MTNLALNTQNEEVFFQEKTKELLKNNLKWVMNYNIPFKFTSKYTKWMLRIGFIKNSQRLVIKNENGLFIPKYLPKVIEVNRMIFSAKEEHIVQLILHELNHWYTYELKGYNVSPHGQEFKRLAYQIGLKPEFAKASVVTSDYNISQGKEYHDAKCIKCGEIVYSAVREKTVKNKCHNSRFRSRCCNSELEYSGTSLY